MRNRIQTVMVIGMVLIYSLVANLSICAMAFTHKHNATYHKAETITYYSISETVLYHESYTENLLSHFCNNARGHIKNLLLDFSVRLKVSESLTLCKFLQYHISDAGLVLRNGPFIFIFPFHYFW